MSRKITSSRSHTTETKKRDTSAKSGRAKTAGPASKASSRDSSTGDVKAKGKTSKKAAAKAAATTAPAGRSSTRTARAGTEGADAAKKQKAPSTAPAPPSSVDLLAKAEADIRAVIESLNQQMSTALTAMTELAVSHQKGRGGAVIRTAPLDRATATFQRLVAQVVEDHVSEMLPPLIALREEMDQRRPRDDGASGDGDDDFWERGVAILDQVLASTHVSAYHARPGERFDPLIHLAVGETWREDLQDGAVAEPLRPGFRTAGGKVIVPARVKVNRR
jgi:hypothetical protein